MLTTTPLPDDAKSISFREKFAWVMSFALGLSTLIIVWVMLPVSGFGMEALRPPVAVALILVIVLQTAMAAIGASISALTNLEDANAPADERDQALLKRASASALTLTQLGLVLSILAFIFGAGTGPFLFGVVLSLHLGELIRQISLIRLYRGPV